MRGFRTTTPAASIRLFTHTHRPKLNKTRFYFRASNERHLPRALRSMQRFVAGSHKADKAHFCTRISVINSPERGPLICRPVISSLTTTQHFWPPGRRPLAAISTFPFRLLVKNFAKRTRNLVRRRSSVTRISFSLSLSLSKWKRMSRL